MTQQRVAWAKALAATGFNIFLVGPKDKNPVHGVSWYFSQTNDPAQIDAWLNAPEGYNYAAYPGESYVVIDLDRKPNVNGIQTFESICADRGIPDLESFLKEYPTFAVRTPRQGYHLYFQSPFPAAIKHYFPKGGGIDVRGVNGYVVGPGCQTEHGEYTPLTDQLDILPLPEFLHEYLESPGVRTANADVPVVDLDLPDSIQEAEDWLSRQEPAVQGDNGDNTTYEVICGLRDFGLSKDQIFKSLNETGWNQKCDPPWSDSELIGKIDNAWNYAQNRPGTKSNSYQIQKFLHTLPMGGALQFMTDEEVHKRFFDKTPLRVVVDNTQDLDPEVPQGVYEDEEGQVHTAEPLKPILREYEDFAFDTAIREYVVEKWLIAHGVTFLIGTRGWGKSTIALDLVSHIATDLSWCGYEVAPDWKVIYVCGEDAEGMRLNCRAWLTKSGFPTIGADRFAVVEDPFSLNSDVELNQRILEMREWADVANGGRAVVVLDTWQRMTTGKAKNDEEAMEIALNRAERIGASLNGPVLVLVHPPKDGRVTVKGAGVQEDVSSGIWGVTKTASAVRLTINRAKGPGEDEYVDFEFQRIEMPLKDQFGKPLTGQVAVKVGGSADIQNAEKIASKQSMWADLIVALDKIRANHDEFRSGSQDHLKTNTILRGLVAVVTHGQDPSSGVHEQARAFMQEFMVPLKLTTITQRTVTTEIAEVFDRGVQDIYTTDKRFKVSYVLNTKSNAKKPQKVFEIEQATIEKEKGA